MIIDFRQYVPNAAQTDNLANLSGTRSGNYARNYHFGDMHSVLKSPTDYDDWLYASGVDHAVLAGGASSYEELAEFISGSRRSTGIAGVRARDRAQLAAQELARGQQLGLKIAGLAPFQEGIPANHRDYYPVYQVCCELGMPIIIHSSFNFLKGSKLRVSNPLHLDDIASDFPDLTIIASHAGWPWVLEMVAAAWHNDNVYIEISSHRAAHMAKPGSGWEPLFNYGNGPLKDKLLWGSIWPFLDLERQLAEFKELPFSAATQERIFDANPRGILEACGVSLDESLPAASPGAFVSGVGSNGGDK